MATRTLAGLVRLRDEETWCRLALDSFIGWVDQLVIVTNTCTDRTPVIVAEFAAEYPNAVTVADYPYRIHPMGPGHDSITRDDPHASAALYNFTQALAWTTHAVKLDGDLVMMDWAGNEIRARFLQGADRIRFHCVDIVGNDLRHLGSSPRLRTNGVYPLGSNVYYDQGAMTQHLRGVGDAPEAFGDEPACMHLKWARNPFKAATCQWPDDWQSIPHFRRIAERRHPVEEYTGEYPSSVRALLGTAFIPGVTEQRQHVLLQEQEID